MAAEEKVAGLGRVAISGAAVAEEVAAMTVAMVARTVGLAAANEGKEVANMAVVAALEAEVKGVATWAAAEGVVAPSVATAMISQPPTISQRAQPSISLPDRFQQRLAEQPGLRLRPACLANQRCRAASR